MRVSRKVVNTCFALGVLALAGTPHRAWAEIIVNGGQVNISGATLFQAFFGAPASTNDWIDVDGDGRFGYDPVTPPFIDQLAPNWDCYSVNAWWLVQYRGVGSGNGLNEFVDYHLLGTLPTNPPAPGLINRTTFATGGVAQPPCGYSCPSSGTPICPESIDLAVMDVPTVWFVRNGSPDLGAPTNRPGDDGYGWSGIASWDVPSYESVLEALQRDALSLNTNVGAPDENTVFDTPIAWVPAAIIVNRGTGIQNISVSELQYLFLTGRKPSGENLVVATRDPGSGTRNLTMNSLGIDPAWGVGDNYGAMATLDDWGKLGPAHQATNMGNSGGMENAVQNVRLAVGYTGLTGGSRAVGDANNGLYEIADVKFDDRGGTQFVRPTRSAVLDNCDPSTGYQIGGNETFASRGNPFQTDSGAPDYVDNQNAADYLRNIVENIADFEEQPGASDSQFMPGRYLATGFFLKAALDCVPEATDPTSFEANPDFNQTLQNWIRAHSDMGIGAPPADTPAYGRNIANKTPIRLGNPQWGTVARPCPPYCPELLPLNGQYSDGSTTGNYANLAGAFTVTPNVNLSERNQIAGDFNNDKLRNLNDIPRMMAAIYDPRAFAAAEGVVAGDPGALGINYVIPEIIGDFNGDGNFGKVVNPVGGGTAWDKQDARYFADGLAIDPSTGLLNRKLGFIAVDNGWQATPAAELNFFGTTKSTGALYAAGDSRGDVAGGISSRGAYPTGFDGVIDCADVQYVCQNFGTWSALLDAVAIDLSCDMDGDLDVDQDDVYELVHEILGATDGDVNLDGSVDAADTAIIAAHLGQPGCWCDGDLDGDGLVTQADMGTPTLTGDANCDGMVNSFDIDPFVMALTRPLDWQATYACGLLAANDCNHDGAVNSFDIDPFVICLTLGCE